MRNLSFFIIPIGLVLITVFSCKRKNITAVLELATAVIEVIDTFVDKSEAFTNRVEEVTDVVTTSIEKEEKIEDIAQFWEDQWIEIKERYSSLENSFSVISGKAVNYFAALDENNAKIINEEFREEDAERTREIWQKWDIEYQKAHQSLQDAKIMLRDGEDFIYILRNEVLRSNISESTSSLNNISNKAKSIGVSIQSFERNTRAIFQIRDNE